ncbi:hypothetical protein [Streptomyces sp. NBC_00557]|uniref:hypothetical protein n=1 Tax=Streptomyces sp. NBC_00557 TaxID=2975776 RepID=UPI002E800054|nr:hypothetical protein [Streptomyces sp. NBC_00557]WUC33981.1 hypothetical protein OG956_07080 [Streptomyces sp. NBC_00557]
MISAVVVPLILLLAVLAPGVYREWRAYVRQNRLPLPPSRSRLVTGRLSAEIALLRRRMTRHAPSGGAPGTRLPHAGRGVDRPAARTPVLNSRGE